MPWSRSRHRKRPHLCPINQSHLSLFPAAQDTCFGHRIGWFLHRRLAASDFAQPPPSWLDRISPRRAGQRCAQLYSARDCHDPYEAKTVPNREEHIPEYPQVLSRSRLCRCCDCVCALTLRIHCPRADRKHTAHYANYSVSTFRSSSFNCTRSSMALSVGMHFSR